MLYFLVSVVIGYFFLKEMWMRWHYDVHKIPCPPKLPFLGHALHFVKGKDTRPTNVWIREWRAKLGLPKVMKLCLMGQTTVIPTDASIIRNVVLSKSVSLPRKGATLRHLSKLAMGDDPTPIMFTTPTPTPYVKAIRRCYLESFTTAGMKQAFHKQTQVMDKGRLYLEGQQCQDTIDLQHFFTRLMLDVAGKVELDTDLGGLDNSSPLCELLIDCGRHMWALTTDAWLELKTKLFPNSETARRIRQDFVDLKEQWIKIATEVRARGEQDEKFRTVADNLSEVCLPDTNDPLPFKVFRGEIATAIFGGFDTVSHQLAWIFCFLATHPHVVEKLLDEFKSHVLYGSNAKELEFEDLSQLKYLKAVIDEGMRRMHATTIIAVRTTNQDLVLGGYRVPNGTLLWVPSHFSMNCEMEWEDHLAFKPERWLNDNINVKEKYYFPFGHGDRQCIGMKFALQAMKVTIVYLVTRYSFELVGESLESLVQNGVTGLAIEARDGMNMKVTPRVET